MKKLHTVTFLVIISGLFFCNCLKSSNSVLSPAVPIERGIVYSVIKNSPLDSVTVTVSGTKKDLSYFKGGPVLTDSNGYFNVGLGTDDYLYQDTAIFVKQGYFDTSYVFYPIPPKDTGNYSGYDTIRMRPISAAKLK